jgi:cytoskeletal protein CcmA (bactofilin family)
MKANEKSGELSTILGKGSVFEGKLKVEHTLRVDGKFTGDITTSDTLIIGKEGNVNGNIKAKTLIVGGTLSGAAEIKEKLVLESKSEFHGEMKTAKLVIDEGAIFDGRCSMKYDHNKPNVAPIQNPPGQNS